MKQARNYTRKEVETLAEMAAKTAEAAFTTASQTVRGFQPVFVNNDASKPENLEMGCIIVNDTGFTGAVSNELCWATSNIPAADAKAGVKAGFVMRDRVAWIPYGPVEVPK